MKIWLNWLDELVDISFDSDISDNNYAALAHKLTFTGTEVENIEMPCGKTSSVVIGEVTELAPHSAKASWKIAKVRTSEKIHTVVTAAPNAKVGSLYPYAPSGACLADGMQLGFRDFEGVQSDGMLLSAAEIGLPELDGSGGLLELPDECIAGADFLEYFGLDYPVFDISVTPNRGDLLSVLGVAREIRALYPSAEVDFPIVDEACGDAPWPSGFEGVKIEDEGCFEYALAYADEIEIAPSPFEIKLKLVLSGMRPVNNIVDATNIAMLLFGQPLHAFDMDAVTGGNINVRSAHVGQRFMTLDGKERTLEAEDLLICTADTPLGIAGIMGGLASEITQNTRHIALESAIFSPARTSKSARRLGISSAAAFRFARGTDPAMLLPAMWYAMSCMEEWGGARLGASTMHVYESNYDINVRQKTKTAPLYLKDMKRTLLFDDMQEAASILKSLGFAKSGSKSPDMQRYRVPSWRNDVTDCADLIEEIGRIRGYDKIEPRFSGTVYERGTVPAAFDVTMQLRGVLISRGYTEVMTYSFIHAQELHRLGIADEPIELKNPISSEQTAMRTSLLPGLLRGVEQNLRLGVRTPMYMFETGRVFTKSDGNIAEKEKIAGLVYLGKDRHAIYEGKIKDAKSEAFRAFLSVKADVEALLAARNLQGKIIFEQSAEGAKNYSHAGQTASLFLLDNENKKEIGVMCRLKPNIELALDAAEGIFYFELDMEALYNAGLAPYGALYRFPSARRDISLFAQKNIKNISSEKIKQDIISCGDKNLIHKVTLFDFFAQSEDKDAVSLAFAVTYRSAERTLQDEEVVSAHDSLRAKLADMGYRLR